MRGLVTPAGVTRRTSSSAGSQPGRPSSSCRRAASRLAASLAPGGSVDEDRSSSHLCGLGTELDMAVDTDAGHLGHLDPAIQKVEFKLTVLAREEVEVQALLQRGDQ